MAQVEQVTHRNAAASEELASTAAEMSVQSATLNQLVSVFRVEGSMARPLRPMSSPPTVYGLTPRHHRAVTR